MIYFPQLISGCMAQYPLTKRIFYRTVLNQAEDGTTYRLEDTNVESLEWVLRYEGLSNQERAVLEVFHREVEGRLREFTFLDPAGNLLARSGEPGASVWQRSPLLTLGEGWPDPEGGTGAFRLTNTGSVEQSLQQKLSVPGWFTYCWSVFVRGVEASKIVLYRRSGEREEAREYGIGPEWERLVHSGASDSQAEGVWFGVRLGPGSVVELYGMQVEAQAGPSPYRKTGERGGVYEGVRLGDDGLKIISTAPEQHACVVRVVARRGR